MAWRLWCILLAEVELVPCVFLGFPPGFIGKKTGHPLTDIRIRVRFGGSQKSFYFFHCRFIVSDAAAKQHLIEDVDSPLLYPIIGIGEKLVNPIKYTFVADDT